MLIHQEYSVEDGVQGAVLQIGPRRVAVFAEGMMFYRNSITKDRPKNIGLTSMGESKTKCFC